MYVDMLKENEEMVLQLIRESYVLVELNPLQWSWQTIQTVLKNHVVVLKRVEDFTLHRYMLRIYLFTGVC